MSLLEALPGIDSRTWLSRRLRIQNLDQVVRRGVRDGNNAFLAFEFGFKPLLQTAKALARSLDKIIGRLSWLRINRGKWATVRVNRNYEYSSPGYPANWGTNVPFCERWAVTAHYSVTCGSHLYQRLEGLDDSDAFLKAFRDYGGFDRILSIAWNAIPFTFVIDWFYDVGQRLEAFKLPPVFEGTFKLRDPWTSCLMTGKADHYVWHFPQHGNNSPQFWSSWGVKNYVRFYGTPVPIDRLNGLSWLQLMLLGSLTIQQVLPLIPSIL